MPRRSSSHPLALGSRWRGAAAGARLAVPPCAAGADRRRPDFSAAAARSLDGDPLNPPAASARPPADSDGDPASRSRRSDRVPNYGYTPATGAGTTGFDSTNVPRKARRQGRHRTPSRNAAATRRQPAPATPDAAAAVRRRRLLPSAGIAARAAAIISRGAAGCRDRRRRPGDAPMPPCWRCRRCARRRPLPRTIRSRRPASRSAPSAAARARGHRRLRHQSGAHATAAGHRGSGVVAPELLVNSNWARHELTADAARQLHRLSARSRRSTGPTFDAKVNGRIDVTSDTASISKAATLVGTDNPGSPNIQAGSRQAADLHRRRRHRRHRPALQPLRSHAQGQRRPHRLSGLDCSPTARPPATTTATSTSIGGAAARELRADARRQAVRRSRRRHAACTISRSTAPACSAIPTGVTAKRRHHLRALAHAHRRSRGRLYRAQLQGPDAADISAACTVDASLIWLASALTTVKLTATHDGRTKRPCPASPASSARGRRAGRPRVPPLADRDA